MIVKKGFTVEGKYMELSLEQDYAGKMPVSGFSEFWVLPFQYKHFDAEGLPVQSEQQQVQMLLVKAIEKIAASAVICLVGTLFYEQRKELFKIFE